MHVAAGLHLADGELRRDGSLEIHETSRDGLTYVHGHCRVMSMPTLTIAGEDLRDAWSAPLPKGMLELVVETVAPELDAAALGVAVALGVLLEDFYLRVPTSRTSAPGTPVS